MPALPSSHIRVNLLSVTCSSEKLDHRLAHRIERELVRAARNKLDAAELDAETILPQALGCSTLRRTTPTCSMRLIFINFFLLRVSMRLVSWFIWGILQHPTTRNNNEPGSLMLKIRDLTLRNRIVVSPMLTYSAVNGHVSDWHLAHLAQFAAGGAGLVFMESTKVSSGGLLHTARHGTLEGRVRRNRSSASRRS